MTLGLRAVINTIVGLVIGAGIVFVAIALSLVYVFVTGGDATLPGIISIWSSTENDAVALNFDPSFLGMGVASLVIAAAYALLATTRGHRRAQAT